MGTWISSDLCSKEKVSSSRLVGWAYAFIVFSSTKHSKGFFYSISPGQQKEWETCHQQLWDYKIFPEDPASQENTDWWSSSRRHGRGRGKESQAAKNDSRKILDLRVSGMMNGCKDKQRVIKYLHTKQMTQNNISVRKYNSQKNIGLLVYHYLWGKGFFTSWHLRATTPRVL